MPNSKCSHCGLVNTSSDFECRRCQSALHKNLSTRDKGPRDAARRSSPLWTLLIITVICAGAWYLYKGVEKSFEQVQADDVHRVAQQPKANPAQPLSRTEYDQQRAGQSGNAVQGSQGINASQQHTAEINKLMNRGTANK
jgi:hypothetical protein